MSARLVWWLRLLMPPLIVGGLILVTLVTVIVIVNLQKPTPSYLVLKEVYIPENLPTLKITIDPFFKNGLEAWGLSTPGGGSTPIYTGCYWLTHSKDEDGGFAYSSVLQGCKPYYWGCGNYSFDPVPATKKLYLTISFAKETVNVYNEEGFAGALVDLWFENFKGDALVIDLYLTRDVKSGSGSFKSVGKGFVYTLTGRNRFGKTYHFNVVLTEAGNGKIIHLDRLSLEPIVDIAFRSFGLDRSEWWLVSVDAGAEAHYSEIYVYLYRLEVGMVATE